MPFRSTRRLRDDPLPLARGKMLLVDPQRKFDAAMFDCVESPAAPLGNGDLGVIEHWGLRSRRGPRPLAAKIVTDHGGMYFEIYQVPEVNLTAILRSGGDWYWSFCSSDGRVQVTSESYASRQACAEAVDILRGGASDADMAEA